MSKSCTCRWDVGEDILLRDSQYAIKVTIMSQRMSSTGKVVTEDSNDRVHYIVRIDEIFKGGEKLSSIEKLDEDGKEILMYTGGNSALCGIDFVEKGVEYLFTGGVYDNKVSTSHCDVGGKWNTLTSELKKKVEDMNDMEVQNAEVQNLQFDPITDNSSYAACLYSSVTFMCTCLLLLLLLLLLYT